MRKNRLGALASASVLAAATILGGAGAANAAVSPESLENLLPEGGTDVVLTISEVADDGSSVSGAVANNLEDAELENCTVTVADATDVRTAQEAYNSDGAFELDGTEAELSDPVAVGDTADWTAEDVDAGEGFTAGAAVECDDDNVAFAYDAGSDLVGSIEDMTGADLGSLEELGILEALELDGLVENFDLGSLQEIAG